MKESLRPSDIAELWQCKEARIYKLIREGKLRAFRVGRLMRVPSAAVEEFEQNCHEDVPPRSKSGYVYFIGAGGSVKIGYAKNVAHRLADLQTSNHEKLVLLHVEEGTTMDEAQLHIRFSRYRHHGEWFSLSGELAEYINLKSAPRVQTNTTIEHIKYREATNRVEKLEDYTKSP